jgi:hypothetical protein
MSRTKSRQTVIQDVKRWNQAICDAQIMLQKVESRAVRLKGAIKTFTELRDGGQVFNGPESVDDLVRATQSESQNAEPCHSV